MAGLINANILKYTAACLTTAAFFLFRSPRFQYT